MNKLKLIVALMLAGSLTVNAQDVFVNGEWIPCNHPVAKHYGFTCTNPPTLNIQVGKTYRHKQAGWVLYITGIVQRSSGQQQFIAEVLNGTDVFGRVLFDKGELVPVSGEFNSGEWEQQ